MKRKKPLYIVDFDDVLTNMYFKWAMLVASDICTPKEICDVLLESDCKNLDDKFGFTGERQDRILEPYMKKGFYDDLPPSRFCERLKRISDKNDIFVLSYIMADYQATEKENWLKKHLPNAKYQFIYYDSKLKKSDIINQFDMNDYVGFADDRVSNIVDVIENTDSREKLFFAPRFGCNTLEKVKEKLTNKNIIKDRKIILQYYPDEYLVTYEILKKCNWHKWLESS